MGIGDFITLLQESLVIILVFLALLAYSMIRGRHALVSLILGLYFALLISLKFPYYDTLRGWAGGNATTETVIVVGVFVVFTFVSTLLLSRFIEGGGESAFEGFWQKGLLAIFGAVIIMAYSYHVLPLASLIEPGTPASMIFAPEEYFFWWLIVPLIGLFLI